KIGNSCRMSLVNKRLSLLLLALLISAGLFTTFELAPTLQNAKRPSRSIASDAASVPIEAEDLEKAQETERKRSGAPTAAEEAAAANASAPLGSPEELMEEGDALFKEKKYGEALVKFRKSRELNEGFLPSWFYEIRTLREMNREKEAKTTAKGLLA